MACHSACARTQAYSARGLAQPGRAASRATGMWLPRSRSRVAAELHCPALAASGEQGRLPQVALARPPPQAGREGCARACAEVPTRCAKPVLPWARILRRAAAWGWPSTLRMAAVTSAPPSTAAAMLGPHLRRCAARAFWSPLCGRDRALTRRPGQHALGLLLSACASLEPFERQSRGRTSGGP